MWRASFILGVAVVVGLASGGCGQIAPGPANCGANGLDGCANPDPPPPEKPASGATAPPTNPSDPADPGPAICGAPIDVLDGTAAPSSRVSLYRSNEVTSPEVHVIAVYETRSDHSANYHPRGTATVRVDRPGRHILLLSAYEPTDWIVTAGPGAIVERVMLSGFGVSEHTATAPQGAAIEVLGSIVRCRYSSPFEEGCEASAAIAAGAPLFDYAGSYRATSFVVRADAEGCVQP